MAIVAPSGVPTDMLDGVTVAAYGHSYLAWPDKWSYLNRLAGAHNMVVRNAAVGGYGSMDTAARVIGSGSPFQWHRGDAHLAVVDTALNDIFGSGMDGLTGFTNAMRATLVFLSAEGPMDDRNMTYPSGGSWSNETDPDRFAGSSKLGGNDILLPTFGRSGKWGIGYAGIPRELGLGATFDVFASDANAGVGSKLGAINCNDVCRTSPQGRTRGANALVVNVPAGVNWVLARRTNSGGGPWLDYWTKIDEQSWADGGSKPLVVLVSPTYCSPEAYQGSQASDAVIDAYANALQGLATEFGEHVKVADIRQGWSTTLMRSSDSMHPDAQGHAHIARTITNLVASSGWWPYTD